MTKVKVQITESGSTPLYHAVVRWDEDAYVLSADFRYVGQSKLPSHPLLNQIERSVGIEHRGCRVLFGDLEILLTADHHIAHLEVRTNPEEWDRRKLAPVPELSPSGSLHFMVRFDENQIATVDAPLSIIEDRDSRQIAFIFSKAQEACAWCRIADDVAVCVNQDQQLCELRIEQVGLARG